MRTIAAYAGAASLLLIGAIAGTALVANAANKSVTLVPPAGASTVQTIAFTHAPNGDPAVPNDTAKVRVTISACASGSGIQDCGTAIVYLDPANASVVAIYTAAVNAWKNAKGY